MTSPTNKKWTRITPSYDVFIKFEQPGDSIEGVWLGAIEGKYESGLGRVRTGDEQIVAFSLKVALQELERVPADTEVEIVFTGRERTKAGLDVKRFELYTADRVETASTSEGARQAVTATPASNGSSSPEEQTP